MPKTLFIMLGIVIAWACACCSIAADSGVATTQIIVGKVASVSDNQDIYVYTEREGSVTVGQMLDIYDRGNPIEIDGKALGYEEKLVAVVEVVRVQSPQLCVVRVTEAQQHALPAVGNLVYVRPGSQPKVREVDFTLVRDARFTGDAIRVAPAQRWTMGAAWTRKTMNVRNAFQVAFDFRITDRGGIAGGGDGFAFVIQNHSATAIYPGDPPGQAYYEIPNSIAVEFDTYTAENNDPDGHHISVQTRGTEKNSVNHNHSLGCKTISPSFADGRVHRAKVEYTPGILSIFIDDMTKPVIRASVDIDKILRLDEGRAWLGFMAGRGNAYEAADILSWSASSK